MIAIISYKYHDGTNDLYISLDNIKVIIFNKIMDSGFLNVNIFFFYTYKNQNIKQQNVKQKFPEKFITHLM